MTYLSTELVVGDSLPDIYAALIYEPPLNEVCSSCLLIVLNSQCGSFFFHTLEKLLHGEIAEPNRKMIGAFVCCKYWQIVFNSFNQH